MSGGKTYSQLSTESLAQPNNTQLTGLVATVFKGETLRSMLLNAYGWWKVSQITYIAALVQLRPRHRGGVRRWVRLRHRPPDQDGRRSATEHWRHDARVKVA